MHFLARILATAIGGAACAYFACRTNTAILLAATAAVIGIHAVRDRDVPRTALRFFPILVFAAGMYGLSFFGERASAGLPLRAIFVFASVWLLGRLCVGPGRMPRARILFRLFLFAHFVRHFVEILEDETRQTLIARKTSAPNLFRSRGISSLVYAVSSILQRCLVRAERFYAAQSLKGFRL